MHQRLGIQWVLTAKGSGSCTSKPSGVLVLEIKESRLGPDPVIASNNDPGHLSGGVWRYHNTIDTCSNEGASSAGYYARAFFSSSPTYHDSPILEVWGLC